MLTFSELGEHLFSVSDLFCVVQTASVKSRFIPATPRPTDAFLLFSGTSGVCYQNDLPPLSVPQGALVYMPRGCSYMWEIEPAKRAEKPVQYLFEFTLRELPFFRDETIKRAFFQQDAPGERLSFGDRVTVVTVRHEEMYRKLFLALICAFNQPEASPLSVYRAVYELFDTLSQNLRAEAHFLSDFPSLQKSAALLEEDNMSMAEIAEACHVGVRCFERRFRAAYGCTPTEYRQTARICRIKELLHDEKKTLEEIAEKSGCCDCGYLCRFFKVQTGMTPGEYRRMYLNQTRHFPAAAVTKA